MNSNNFLNSYKVSVLIDNEELLKDIISERVSLELDNQKKSGKEFISDESIDNLINDAILEESENYLIEYESPFDKFYNRVLTELKNENKLELNLNQINGMVDNAIKNNTK